MLEHAKCRRCAQLVRISHLSREGQGWITPTCTDGEHPRAHCPRAGSHVWLLTHHSSGKNSRGVRESLGPWGEGNTSLTTEACVKGHLEPLRGVCRAAGELETLLVLAAVPPPHPLCPGPCPTHCGGSGGHGAPLMGGEFPPELPGPSGRWGSGHSTQSLGASAARSFSHPRGAAAPWHACHCRLLPVIYIRL